MAGHPNLSSSQPLSCELSKRTDLGADNYDVELRNGQPSSPSQHHCRTVSAGGTAGKTEKKSLPPPPPKRNENTRLSGDIAKQQQNVEPVPNEMSLPVPDPIYENFDGIMDIDELPPPPPELLMDFLPSECEDQMGSVSARKAKPPPPPPKRSKETQLSSH